MAALSAGIKKLFGRTRLQVMPEDYYVVHLPVDAKPIPGEWYRPATTRFAVFIREPSEITLVVPRRKWLRMQNIFEKFKVTGPMKVVAFDVKLSMVAFGYMAAIGTVLTEAKISAVPISSFHHDHILVKKSDLPRTVKVLRQFLDDCRKK
jgi:hypothetical protein